MVRDTFWLFFLFSSLAWGDSQEILKKIDPNKFTVCAITINSDNEKKVFQNQIKKHSDKMNPIVELTDFDSDRWFEKACESGVVCDQLIVSGHFAGMFFGKSDKKLSIDEMENKGCSKKCDGILSHPYEVFLFGCNTLSTKEKDSRSPEQYLQILLADGIPRREAEMVMESRYGNIGDDHKSKMKRAFGGEKKQLYGFYSVGPSGSAIESFLKKYFDKVDIYKRLKKLSTQRMIDQVDMANSELKEALKVTNFTQCPSGGADDELDEKKRIICGLRDSRKNVDQKLSLVLDALMGDNYLSFIPSIDQFFQEHPPGQFTADQKKVLTEISQNKVIHDQVLNLINKTKNLTMVMEWIKFAAHLKFINEEQESQMITKRVAEVFSKNLSLEDKDMICSLDHRSIGKIKLKLSDIKFNTFTNNDFKAIGCLGSADRDLHKKMIEGLNDPSAQLRASAAEAFKSVTSLDLDLQMLLVDKLNDSDPTVRMITAWSFGGIKPQDLNVQMKLALGLKDSENLVRQYTIRAFTKLKPLKPKILLRIKELDPEVWKDLQK